MTTTRMTAQEAREYTKKNKAGLQAAYDAAKPVSLTGPTKRIARGFAEFKEYINRNGRPKVADPKVSISIRIPLSRAEELRASGRGWQTRASDYIVKGIDTGKLAIN